MSENEMPDNLAFMGLNDPGDESDAPPPDEGGAPEATPQPEEIAPQEAVQPQEDPNERRFRGVLNELRDTRQELRAYREEAEALRAERERQRQAQETPPPPDKDADPAAWLAYQNRLAVWEVEQRRMEQEEMARENYEREATRTQFFQTVGGLEEQFRQERPDYDNAILYAKQVRAQELAGQGLTDEQIAYQVQREIMGFTALNLRNGQSPAQAAYNFAVSRGYRPPSPQPPMQAPQTNGYRQPQPRVHTSLSAAPGGTGGRGITLANLAEQPVSVQNRCFDDPVLWEALNMNETIYL